MESITKLQIIIANSRRGTQATPAAVAVTGAPLWQGGARASPRRGFPQPRHPPNVSYSLACYFVATDSVNLLNSLATSPTL